MKSKPAIEAEYKTLLNSRTEDMFVMDAAEVIGMIKALRWVLEIDNKAVLK